MISSLTSETEGDLYALYRKYDKEGNLSIYTYAIDGKNTDKGYAFGLGLERIANLLYRVSDLRLFSENNVKFLEEFTAAN